MEKPIRFLRNVITQSHTQVQMSITRKCRVLEKLPHNTLEKQPLEFPNAGSVFKRPANDYASRLIDDTGLRGLTVGGAKVSEKHAGFIVNFNHATPQDIYRLIEQVRQKVKEKHGIELELEQILWGRFD